MENLERGHSSCLLPLEKIANEGLQTPVDAAELSKAVDEDGEKTFISKQIVDKRKDIKREIDRQLPRILQRESFLISERIVAGGISWHVSLVDRFHHL